MRKSILAIIVLLLLLAGAGVYLAFNRETLDRTVKEHGLFSEAPLSIQLTSPDFEQGGLIPVRFTCDGEDVSPTLVFSKLPSDAKSLALIVDDPDAPNGRWIHWLLWNISPDINTIKSGETPQNSISGVNDFRETKYRGPCPAFSEHRYFFTIYALNTEPELAAGESIDALEEAMRGHVLARGQLMGRYQ